MTALLIYLHGECVSASLDVHLRCCANNEQQTAETGV